METLHLPRSLFGDDFEHVYEPAEDTFLLLDALESDLPALRGAQICLECGSGSGVVATALSKALPERALLFATDINPRACETTKKCVQFHLQAHQVQVVNTDLAQALVDRLEGQVDVLIFNPPYVPTEDTELNRQSIGAGGRGGSAHPPRPIIYASWAGGELGRQVSDRFLRQYVPRLLSKLGRAYLVALDRNGPTSLASSLAEFGICGSVVMERRAGIEQLAVIRYERMS